MYQEIFGPVDSRLLDKLSERLSEVLRRVVYLERSNCTEARKELARASAKNVIDAYVKYNGYYWPSRDPKCVA